MSGVGPSELIVLVVIGLLILGPERLPRVATQIGRWIGKARRTANQLRYQLEREIALADIEEKKKNREDKKQNDESPRESSAEQTADSPAESAAADTQTGAPEGAAAADDVSTADNAPVADDTSNAGDAAARSPDDAGTRSPDEDSRV